MKTARSPKKPRLRPSVWVFVFGLEQFISVILSSRELSLELTFREIDFSFLIYLYFTEKLIQMEVILEENL